MLEFAVGTEDNQPLPSGGEPLVITLQDDLMCLFDRIDLGRASTTTYSECSHNQNNYSCAKKSEIDLHAFLLMSENDLAEVGIPKVSV